MSDPITPQPSPAPPRQEKPAAAADPAVGAHPAEKAPSASPPGAGAPGGGALLTSFRGRRDNFDLLKALFLGVSVTALFYEVFPLPFIEQGRVLTLFDNPISEVITAMTFWSLFILFFKMLRFRLQQKAIQAFADPGIQGVLAKGVYARDVDEVLEKLREGFRRFQIKAYESSVIFRRVFQVLHFIRSVPKKESVNGLLEYQAEIDLKKLESGYSILQVFIWAIPILGFIGTVLGIGEAVSQFSIFIQTAESGAQFSAQMRNALGGVTGGLAVAFNTTFLALVLVIPVMILTSLLQKNEEELLLAVEEYCLDELLPYLRITPSNDAVTETFDEHMHRLMLLSNNWLEQMEPLVARLSQQAAMVGSQIEGVQPVVKAFTDRLLGQPKAAPEPATPPQPAAAGAGQTTPPATRGASAKTKPRAGGAGESSRDGGDD